MNELTEHQMIEVSKLLLDVLKSFDVNGGQAVYLLEALKFSILSSDMKDEE